MEWLAYLLEANLYLLAFYGFYCLFLKNQTFYNSNRFYLVVSSLIAFVMPILQIGYLKPKPIQIELLPVSQPLYSQESLTTTTTEQVATHFDLSAYLYPLYLIIAIGFALKLGIGLIKICRLWLRAPKTRSGAVTIVELNEQTSAFSFFNLLFIHSRLSDRQTVLKHEMVHIKQRHSFDILFFEIMQIVCWFNPIIYFIQKDIKLLHEYIADHLTAGTIGQKHQYAMFLIENSFGVAPNPLTNQIFNQSILKRRINMLNKKRSANWARLRLLLVLPLGGAMLCTSTLAFTKDYGYVDLLPEKSETTTKTPAHATAATQNKAKQEQVKPLELKIAHTFIPSHVRDAKTGKIRSTEKRYIIVNNEKVKNMSNFYGVTNTQKMVYLNAQQAQKKYGQEGKYGAVEITGANIKWLAATDVPPQLPPKVDQVRFPPPIVRPDVITHFYPRHTFDVKTNKMLNIEKRLIVINGEPVKDNSTFYGVEKSESVVFLSPTKAMAIYGKEKGKNGAVEVKGANIEYLTEYNVVPPPAIEPPPPHFKAPKKKGYKFPPPIIKPDAKKKNNPVVEEVRSTPQKLPSVTVEEKVKEIKLETKKAVN